MDGGTPFRGGGGKHSSLGGRELCLGKENFTLGGGGGKHSSLGRRELRLGRENFTLGGGGGGGIPVFPSPLCIKH